MTDWVDSELETLELGDERRKRRYAKLLRQLQSHAESSTAAVRGDDAQLTGTYRLMNNVAFDHHALFAAHNDAAIRRATEQAWVILTSDTTVVDLTKPSRQVADAGPLESENKFGFFYHPIYAVTPEGLPLGCVDQFIWTRRSIRRDRTAAERSAQLGSTPLELKESCRWLELHQRCEQLARADPTTRYVAVSDSESDIYEVLREAEDAAENFDYVLRGCHDRRVFTDRGDKATVVSEALGAVGIGESFEVEVSQRRALVNHERRARRRDRDGRIAKVSVRSIGVRVAAPAGAWGKSTTAANLVEVFERDSPEDCEPIRWILWTSLPIDSVEAVRRVISAYCRRWDIEVFFKTLKSGMGLEKLKYRTLEAYLKMTAALVGVAWRVEQLKGACRVCPERSCDEFFEGSFWSAVMSVLGGGVAPEDPPTIAQFAEKIASLGGYLANKGKGPPGSMTLWRGLQTARAYHEAYLALVGPP